MAFAPAYGESGHAVKGILLMTFAAAMFACLDATAKYLGRTMDSVDIVWLRYISHVIILSLFLRVWFHPSAFRTEHPFMQTLRGLTLLGRDLLQLSGRSSTCSSRRRAPSCSPVPWW